MVLAPVGAACTLRLVALRWTGAYPECICGCGSPKSAGRDGTCSVSEVCVPVLCRRGPAATGTRAGRIGGGGSAKCAGIGREVLAGFSQSSGGGDPQRQD